jgi:hypothetical protein
MDMDSRLPELRPAPDIPMPTPLTMRSRHVDDKLGCRVSDDLRSLLDRLPAAAGESVEDRTFGRGPPTDEAPGVEYSKH